MGIRMRKESGIYRFRNLVNGRVYVGSSNNLPRRKLEHISSLTRDKHRNQFLQNDWNKCGSVAFCFETIMTCVAGLTVVYEQLLLDELWDAQNKCYNIDKVVDKTEPTLETREKISDAVRAAWTPERRIEKSLEFLGNKINLGKQASNETRQKMSTVRRGKKHAEEWCRKIGVANTGKRLSEERKQAISKFHKGRKWRLGMKASEETKKRISEAGKGRHYSEETKRKMSETQKRIGNKPPWYKKKQCP